ncbi:transglycosylase domain-containing protein [Tetragenococcus halophilus]|uniref:transglycosylase domain-containing protein n=1 Tax=Tetragenococcus halophilus TaxID=51669 RepID=UPI0005A2AD48|nr:transglycosylase domain-containing protein [Tetragenococcus halophilus]MCO7025698.1 penicillin-binding protein [Tetragenococcus halophilus]GBD70973.1 penicillin-binding protein 1b [Tetragenococcus halophilus subsp. halophilus]GBD79047.1 penicillin-binding protein 1b [Tetragenococcus halophilus subsp. halophilus]GFK29187.1 transglycosylase [Tetragenococcus halophilus]GLL51657.1 peptidase [Tetragenococcus halophilus]
MSQQEKNSKKVKQTKQQKNSGWFYFHIVIRVLQSLLLVVISLFILFGALGAGMGAGYFAYLVEDTKPPTKEELEKNLEDMDETSHLAYANGSNIATIKSDIKRNSVDSDQISDLVKKAVIATEDEDFYQHKGVVPKAVLRALVSEVTGIGPSGGSTLTQQIVKQQILSDEVTFERKANEILLATQVERNFSKDEIVEMYLNVSPFGRNNKGENIAGVQEAAEGIFGENADELSLPQAAFIAGLPQSPIAYSPYTNTGELQEDLEPGLDRKDYVLFSMYRNHDISKQEYEEARDYDLTADFQGQESSDNNNERNFLYNTVMNEALEIVAQQLADEDNISSEEFAEEETYQNYIQEAQQKLANGGYTVNTTIDQDIYNAMQDTAENYGYLLDNNNQVEVGNVYMDNETGKILGFVGGRNYEDNQFNHAFNSTRQAGSAIKPALVYGPAIDQGLIGTESRVSDYPTKWRQGENKGDPIVNATNKGTKTFQTVRESLEHSSNIASYHIYRDILDEEDDTSFVYDNYLKKMNYPDTDSWTYESASSGVTEVTTLQQTNGFQALANDGVYQEGYLIDSITDSSGDALYKHKENPERVYSKQAASIMNDLMRGVIDSGHTTEFKSDVSNLNYSLANADWVGKTGTTDDYKDSWLVVSTPKATLSSWSGREDNQGTDRDASKRTAQYMSYLANSIYQANPDSLGADEDFELDDDVKEEEVSEFTGTKVDDNDTVEVDGSRMSVPSDTTDSYWAKGTPPGPSFKFGIGGSDNNYEDYWKNGPEDNNSDNDD